MPASSRATERGSRGLDVGIGLVCVLVIGLAAALEVVGQQVLSPDGTALGSTCWSRDVLDLACPFCGMTRSVIAVVHTRFATSLAFHPGGLLVVLSLLGSALAIAALAVTGRRPLSSRAYFWKLVEGVALICLLLGIARWLW